MQDRAFLGVTTLNELVMKRPQGPGGNQNFLEALLDVTNSDIELVSCAGRTVLSQLFYIIKLYALLTHVYIYTVFRQECKLYILQRSCIPNPNLL